MANNKPVARTMRPWFGGDRTLAEQMLGLEDMFERCAGRHVLDVGCAEGDIAEQASNAGAAFVVGVEIVQEHVLVATGKNIPDARFICADVNEWKPHDEYGVVLLLAILHKLKDPRAAAVKFADACTDLLVVRWPNKGPHVINDSRSGNKNFHVTKAILKSGFILEKTVDGPRGELVSYFRRVR